ncbi:MAG TPA: threonine/serine exporter family protein, partial [Rudaea sp.]|nr:threonine/serine exporter family protein [Rudaea sp.]
MNAPAAKRMAFVVEIARRLHQYGTSAARLEDAIDSVSARLDLNCQSLSTPTSILFSFTDRASGNDALAELTQVIRVSPGQDDLANLSAVNEIADCVTDGAIGIDEGFRRLREIRDRPGARRYALEILAYGIAAAAVAAILNSAWVDLATAFGIGTIVGALAALCELRPRLRPSLEALSAMIATFIATLVDIYVTPLTLRSVVLASLIVLLPGLSLTTAVR